MLLATFYTFDITHICNITFTKILAILTGKIAKSSQWTMFTILSELVNNFSLHLEFGLKFRNTGILGENYTWINQSVLLDGGQRSNFFKLNKICSAKGLAFNVCILLNNIMVLEYMEIETSHSRNSCITESVLEQKLQCLLVAISNFFRKYIYLFSLFSLIW